MQRAEKGRAGHGNRGGVAGVNCGPSVLMAESYWLINSRNEELSLKVGDDTNSDFKHTVVQGGWQKWVARC